MALLSVLASTTRKFFWLSGGWVTCYVCHKLQYDLREGFVGVRTPTPARSMPVTVSCAVLVRMEGERKGGVGNLIADYGEELPVFVGWCCHCECEMGIATCGSRGNLVLKLQARVRRHGAGGASST